MSSDTKCDYCGNTDFEAPLLSAKEKGETKWVCVRCLPRLIHGWPWFKYSPHSCERSIIDYRIGKDYQIDGK